MTDDQRRAGIAYAKTVQAHELLMVFNLQYDNGIRVDVAILTTWALFFQKMNRSMQFKFTERSQY